MFPFDLMSELQEILERQQRLSVALQRQDGRLVPWVFHEAGEPLLDRSGRAKHAVRVAWKGGVHEGRVSGSDSA